MTVPNGLPDLRSMCSKAGNAQALPSSGQQLEQAQAQAPGQVRQTPGVPVAAPRPGPADPYH